MSQRTRADSPTKDCTRDGCTKPMRAKGFCSTHYNQTLPGRHAKTMRPCDGCGMLVAKEARTPRYERTICSDLCRYWVQWGAWSSKLPADHWAILFGATCEWKAPEVRTRTFFCGRCAECDASIVEIAWGIPSKWCSKTCHHRVKRRNRRAAECGATGTFTFTDVMRQYHRQGMVCAYCKQPALALPEGEHVVPLSRGGDNAMTNIVAACHACNANKSDLTLDEWRDHRYTQGLPAVDTALAGDAFDHLIIGKVDRPAYRFSSTSGPLPRVA